VENKFSENRKFQWVMQSPCVYLAFNHSRQIVETEETKLYFDNMNVN